MRRRPNLRLALPAALVAVVALGTWGASRAESRPLAPLSVSAPAGQLAPSTGQLQLVLPLVADQAGLARFARAVSTPGSPEFGRFESIRSLAARFGASARTRRLVIRFLRGAGARGVRIDATGLFADARIRTALASRLFDASLGGFVTATSARFTAPTSQISLPRGLRGLVTGVVGLDTRPLATAPRLTHPPLAGRARNGGQLFKSAASPAGSGYICSTPGFPTSTACPGLQVGCAAARATGGFTPNQYLAAYGYSSVENAAARGRGERVALIEIDGFKRQDVDTFARCFGLRVPQINAFGVGGVGKALPPGGEATLDLEVLDAAASNLRAIDVYEARADAADTLMALTKPLQNPGFKPQIISASLGLCEAFTIQDVGRAGVRAAESALAEAAASGITFLAASGDDGSADCTSSGKPANKLAVNYPASSQWATAVGGTNFALDAADQIVPGSEVVWNDGSAAPGAAGGGGFSSLFTRPSYQSAVVTGTARAVPDVAMLADVAPGYSIYCSATSACTNGHSTSPWQTVGGTSAGTPLLAGGFALVDELLRTHQLQPLGLANPLLYQLGATPALAAQVFYDVASGSNDVGPFIGGAATGCCAAGPGYDEASGWGGVNLAAFANQALAMQPKIVDVGLTLPSGQHPGRGGRILAVISCSGPCLADVGVAVKVARHRPFVAYSRPYRLAAAGMRAAKVTFSGAQRAAIRSGLANHQRVLAGVQSAIIDPAGNIERRSRAIVVQISS